MSDQNSPQEPQEEKAIPSVGTQIKVVVIVIIGITVVLGGGVLLSSWLG